ncbi:sulfite exporter TauE/SafE family protein [Mariniblastus fucicola]|uniref:Probable membrane transporter protein n=1 Tax=Mariniblastus fucicola TaxID=980251 RepID=A0A5B9P1J7_9BACT|nr:sulfite exporter TauE/SafE family protein [Mariniblastus fucicola]QEG20387.1 Sulfite exporter TauE/SafE [Mariniblastus fucicola]
MKEKMFSSARSAMLLIVFLSIIFLATSQIASANPNLAQDVANAADGLSGNWLLTILIVAVIAFVAGVVHSGIGFGFGIVAIGVMPLVIDARQTQLLVSLLAIPVQIGTVWAYRRGFAWRPLLYAFAGAIIGLPLGLWLFKSINLDWLTRGTGVVILFMVAWSFWVRRLASRRAAENEIDSSTEQSEPTVNPVTTFGVGLVSGFLMGAVTMPGPPVVAWAMQQDWSQERFKAFVNQFLLALTIFKVAALFITAEVGQQIITESLLIFPAALIGIAVGKKFSERLSAGSFRTLVAVGLSIVAVLLITKGSG